ncbi:unnamed protein product [Brachionus calyciflorus]|uniref:Apple domain-containing protein n=1 Tax=Brachionus calyciflorus TaxID=104777 RepID=A0A813TXJ8_9BILA|nr:unnamed protein product [Brachionus calyciflorus]
MKFVLIVLSLILISNKALSQKCTYEANVDYFGNDLFKTPTFVSSLEFCCSFCEAVSECGAWTFLPSTGACWLKSKVGTKQASNGRSSGLRQSVLSTATASTTLTTIATTTATAAPTTTKQSICAIEFDTNYPGNDLKGVGSVKSPGDCCNLCGSTTGCAAWSYYTEYQYCYLKNSYSNTGKEVYGGMISGLVSK